MIQNKSIHRLKSNHPYKIIIALNKIARDTGEFEYGSICFLETKLNIKILFEEIAELRGRYIWVWVIRPFNEELLKYLERKLTRLNLPLMNYLKIFNFNKLNYIKYPEKVEICRVNKEIFEIMREQHNITDNSFDWEKIQTTKTWLITQIQVTREFIADKILKKETIS